MASVLVHSFGTIVGISKEMVQLCRKKVMLQVSTNLNPITTAIRAADIIHFGLNLVVLAD